MSASGAKVLMLRSVELARNHGVRIHARSTFSDEEGTWVQEERMEQPIVSAVTHSENDVVFTLSGIPDRPGVAALIFDVVAAAQVNVDTIIQNVVHGNAEMSFSVPAEDVAATRGAIATRRTSSGRSRRGEPRPRQGVADRRRHALAPGRRGEDVPHARRQRHQPADDLDLADQDLLHDRPRPRSRTPCAGCTPRSQLERAEPSRGERERSRLRRARAAGSGAGCDEQSPREQSRPSRRSITGSGRLVAVIVVRFGLLGSPSPATSGDCDSATRWPSRATERRSTSCAG